MLAIAFASTVMAKTSTNPQDIALRPQQNDCRNMIQLDGVWNFRVDSADVGEQQQWMKGLSKATTIAVPGSWNEQINGLRNYLGKVWYERQTFVPAAWRTERVFLRIGSATYAAKVWVNGRLAGEHEGGNLPFAIDISGLIKYGTKNRITISVENELSPERIPTGGIKGVPLKNIPATNYDFFPYSGLQRSVMLCTVPREASLSDITATTDIKGTTGIVNVALKAQGTATAYRLVLTDSKGQEVQQRGAIHNSATATLRVPNARLWAPEHPNLYTLRTELLKSGKVVDSYECRIGIRTIRISGTDILLNGKPIVLRGFGKHEDYPIFGRGVAMPVTVKDFELMRWCGANSFRTSHYPYDESVYDIADEQGFLIIDEIPAVGLIFYDSDEAIATRKAKCLIDIEETIHRDKNHPSVIIWSVANEPSPKNLGGDRGATKEEIAKENVVAEAFLTDLIKKCHAMDATRPAAFVGVMGGPASWMKACDLLLINRYYGWYTTIGDLTTARKWLSGELDKLHATYDRPIVLTEFGADAFSGMHSSDSEAYSEEFQRDFINTYLDVANTKDYVKGMMVWCFADFRTGQGLLRPEGINQKGVFTRERQPKLAAHLLRERWAMHYDKKF